MTIFEALAAIFTSNPRSTGQFLPDSGKMHTKHLAINTEDWEQHVRGSLGVGCVAILDDNTCHWAAIDIDNHGTEEDIPLAPMATEILAHNLPLIPCRSKSGGIHCYAFFETPQPAAIVRQLLSEWAALLGWPGAEIFPKQDRLGSSGGKKALGNWINMPYLGGDETARYALHDGKKLSLADFIRLARRMRISEKDMHTLAMARYEGAPPCIKKMLSNGVEQGLRNEVAFHFTLYAQKAFPGNVEGVMQRINNTIFAKPLPKSELARTVQSACRPDYRYRCNMEPMRSLCDRAVCVKCKFGITENDAVAINELNGLPLFSNLVKYMSEPIRWEMLIDGKLVTNIGTPQLLEWRFMREMIAERLTKIVPMIKPQEWERTLSDLMQQVRIIDAPDDASVAGVIRERLREFAAKTELTNRGENAEDRRALLRGLPCVQQYDGERCVMFRAQDFVNYLKRTKSEELKGINMWFAVKELGVRHTKIRAGDHNINVWMMPVADVLKETSSVLPVEFKTEM